MSIRCKSGKRLGESPSFSQFFQHHTHQHYILRHCTNIAYLPMSMIQVHVFTFLVRVVISIRLYCHCRRFMFYLCYLYLYWYPTRFPYRKLFVLINSNITGATSGAGTAYPSVSPACTPVCVGFVLLDMQSVYCFVYHCLSCSYFLFWTLYCLSVFDLWLLITTLISSNLYYTCNCC